MIKNKKLLIVFPLIMVVAAASFWLFRHDSNPEISYRSRQYGPSRMANQTLDEVNSRNHNDNLVSTGQYVRGLEIWVSKESLGSYVPTVIYFKNKDATFKSYELSGGP
ncbi:MAG: hypothetical protein Q7S53_04495 [bacterium]|nr:hypothetical protein [bacterium]